MLLFRVYFLFNPPVDFLIVVAKSSKYNENILYMYVLGQAAGQEYEPISHHAAPSA